jgi:hypothetical protein
MPITQSRMIALINAGRDYKQAFENARQSIEVHMKAAQDKEESWEEALTHIWSFTLPKLLVTNMNSAAVLEVEYSHFRSFQNKNNRAAKAARRRRDGMTAQAQDPAYPRLEEHRATSAPESIARKSTFITSGSLRATAPPPPRPKANSSPSGIETNAKQLEQGGDIPEGADVFDEEDVYIPAELSEDKKAEIDAAAKFLPKPGYKIAQSMCLHQNMSGEEVCQLCGKEMVQ